MIKKTINIIYLVVFFIFSISIIIFYISDENIKSTHKTRALHFDVVEKKIKNLPLLKNDTSDIIVYRDDIQIYKKNIKTYKFWDLLKK